MNGLQKIFNYGETQVRTVLKGEDVWFVAKDVCNVLELTNPTVSISRLDEDEVTKFNLGGLSGETNIVNESGLYSLILGSRKPEAKQFKRWITHEVIPSIRKHGAYMTPQTIEDVLLNPDTIIRLATDLKEERNKREQLEIKQKQDEPFTTFGKVVSNSTASINIGAFAKLVYDKHEIKLGRNKMFEWLREKGYLIRHGRERNNPKQQYIEQGLFDTTVTMVSRTAGDVESLTTLITGKGQVKLTEHLLKDFKGVTT